MPDDIVLLTNPIHPEGEAILRDVATLVVAPDTRPETLRDMAHEATGIVVRAKLPDDIADHAPKLKGIVRHGVGLDFIPVAQATNRGIAVANLPGSNTNAVAEYVFAALFNLRRPLAKFNTVLREDGWDTARGLADRTREITSDTLGIVGVGAIGSRIAAIARQGFGMRILGTSRRSGNMPDGVEEVDLKNLFSRSDAVVLCCALTDETRGMVNSELLGAMKADAVLINVSRGPVVDTAALREALENDQIGGAALDVYDEHPLQLGDPLLSLANLQVSPHVAAITSTSMRAMSVGAAEEMRRILTGERPMNLVNPEIHERES